jgi:hypothetical protein
MHELPEIQQGRQGCLTRAAAPDFRSFQAIRAASLMAFLSVPAIARAAAGFHAETSG